MGSADSERQGDAMVPERILPQARPGRGIAQWSAGPPERELDIDWTMSQAGAVADAIGEAMSGQTTWLVYHGRRVAAIVPATEAEPWRLGAAEAGDGF